MRHTLLSRFAAFCWIPVIAVVALTAGAGLVQAQTGIVTFSQSAYSVDVSQSSAPITVVFTGSADGPAGIGFTTSDGTATAGVDYAPTNGTLVFAAGVLTNTFSVPVLDAGVANSTQTVNLVLFNPTGFALLGNPSTATLAIINGNTQEVQFAQTAYEVNQSESNVVITLVRTGAPNGAVSVDFKTSDGSAKAGVDYTATTGTVVFANGVLTNTVNVPLLNSGGLKTNQTVNLTLTHAVGTALGSRQHAVLTIVATGSTLIQFSAPKYRFHEHAGRARLTVIRFGDSSETASVFYATSDGTATNRIDYKGVTGTLVFPPDVASTNFSFRLVKYSKFQPNKTVFATLNNPIGGGLGTQATAVVAIVNDRKQTVTVTNGSSELVTITLQHAGTMDVFPPTSPADILLSETDASSVLSVRVKKRRTGTGLLQVGGIIGDGSCGTINAPSVDLVGSGIDLSGYLKELRIHDVRSGAAVTAGGTAGQNTTIVAHNLDDGATIDVWSRIKTLRAAQFSHGTIIAPSIGKMFISGAISNASSITVTNGNIGSLVAAQIIDSTVFVGYTSTDPSALLDGGTFVPHLQLKSLRVKSSLTGFANSYVVASKIGRVRLTSVLTNNGGVPFGIRADESITSVKVKAPLFKWSKTGLPDQSSGDFHVIHP